MGALRSAPGWRARTARTLRRARADEAGVSAVEFALVLPVMVVMCLGSFQLYWIARAQMLATNAARVLADLVSQEDTVTAPEMTDYCIAAKLSMQPMAASALTASVASVTNAAGTRSIDWTDRSCGAVATIADAATTAKTVTPNSKNTAIVVAASYTVTLPFGFPLSSTVTVSATAVAAPRDGTTVFHV